MGSCEAPAPLSATTRKQQSVPAPARRPRTVNDVSTYHVTLAALEDRLLAVNDRHVGQRQLEDDCKERRTEPT